jgi:hypothetical protein
VLWFRDSLSWIRVFFHPGSRVIKISDPGSVFSSKNLGILHVTQKLFLSSRKYDPACSSRIRILIFNPSRILDPGVKKALHPGSRSATLEGSFSGPWVSSTEPDIRYGMVPLHRFLENEFFVSRRRSMRRTWRRRRRT